MKPNEGQLRGDHGSCETVRIKHDIVEGNDTGYTEINKHDFDPDVHELYKGKAAKAGDDSKDYASMTKAQIGELLSAAKVEFDPKDTKDVLVALAEKSL